MAYIMDAWWVNRSNYHVDIPVRSCPTLPVKDFLSWNDTSSTTFGTVVDVTCLTGYMISFTQPHTTSVHISCLADGSWSRDPTDIHCEGMNTHLHVLKCQQRQGLLQFA